MNMPNSWMNINDDYYAMNGDKFVVAWWNGIKPDNSGRQSCSFLTDRTRAYGPEYALSSIWPDEAKTFDDKESAIEFLKLQDSLRPGGPISDTWFVSTLRELDQITGYRPNTKAAILGNEETEATTAAPRM